jgi:hypothetical protein
LVVVHHGDGLGGNHRVDVVGDSLVHQAITPLRERFEDAGYTGEVEGFPGQALSSGVVRNRLDLVATRPADVLVLATAANDARTKVTAAPGAPAAAAYRTAIAELLDRFADRCVVVVNARDRTDPVYLPARAALLNSALDQLEHERSNLVVVNWAERSRNLPTEWFSSDQLHFGGQAQTEQPDSPSSRAYVDAIADGVHDCLDKQ